MNSKPEPGVAAPCGLYCGNCIDTPPNGTKSHYVSCTRQNCPSGLASARCEIYQCCVSTRGLIDCAACIEFPCKMLLRFSHQPAHPERLSVIFNLQRRQAVGQARWLAEERLFWQQPDTRRQWVLFRQAVLEKWQSLDALRSRIAEITFEVEMAQLYPEGERMAQGVGTQCKP